MGINLVTERRLLVRDTGRAMSRENVEAIRQALALFNERGIETAVDSGAVGR